ncbi:MAG: SNF2-related protein [Pseudomonadota bacterium]
MQNDLTFFTNEPGSTLLDRFKKTLRDVKFFDILVGYFRTSGFDKLHESFATVDNIRILVGLNVDWKAFEIIDACQSQSTMDFESHKRTKEIFSEAVTSEMDRSPDSFETELGVRKFVEFLRSGKMESLGKLDHIIKEGAAKFDFIFIDEAHRFRNEVTQGYEKLHHICFGKKVILVSATPLNNTVEDIYSQLKLFQVPKKSTIPGVPDLEKFFAGLKSRLDRYAKTDPGYADEIKGVSRDVREKVLKYVMIRRTRPEVINFFKDDMATQGLSFPELGDPQRQP